MSSLDDNPYTKVFNELMATGHEDDDLHNSTTSSADVESASFLDDIVQDVKVQGKDRANKGET